MRETMIIGNLRIEPRDKTVALRLNTDANGYALFAYKELPTLVAHLKTLIPAKAKATEDDFSHLI